MKIYLDMCTLQRPLDDKAQLRIRVEAEAVLGIMAACESGQAELIVSEAHVFEADANSDPVRRDFAASAIAKNKYFVRADDRVQDAARGFVGGGIKPLDALHLASAVTAEADFFCTCDDRLLKKARRLNTAPTKIVLPWELISELQA